MTGILDKSFIQYSEGDSLVYSEGDSLVYSGDSLVCSEIDSLIYSEDILVCSEIDSLIYSEMEAQYEIIPRSIEAVKMIKQVLETHFQDKLNTCNIQIKDGANLVKKSLEPQFIVVPTIIDGHHITIWFNANDKMYSNGRFVCASTYDELFPYETISELKDAIMLAFDRIVNPPNDEWY